MVPPPQLVQWLRRTYPQPHVDPEWLNDCYDYIINEHRFDPATDMDAIIKHVDDQLLESDLRDSMVPGTGLLQDEIDDKPNLVIRGPVLVQIIAITEIGHSAFSLMNVRQARIERQDLAGFARAEGQEDDDDEGPIPAYPRSTLQLRLSDGATTLDAVENKRLPEIDLGETKLGFKLLLKNAPVRKGYAFLEPSCVVMKGHQNADLDAFQNRDFVRGLRVRLGLPDDPEDDEPDVPAPPVSPPAAPMPAPRPNPPHPRAGSQLGPSTVRSPLRELPDPPSPPVAGPSCSHHDDEGQLRRRKLPTRAQRTPSPSPRRAPGSAGRSRYFAQDAHRNPSAPLARAEIFSPPGRTVVDVPDSDDDDARPAVPARTPSSEYEFDDDSLDSAVLEQLTRDEQQAVTGSSAAVVSTQRTLVGSTQVTGASSQRTVVGTMSGSAHQVSSVVESSRTVHARRGGGMAGDSEIIEIDSDTDDKENVPAPTRHVRRRTEPADETIDLM